jgi:hypothetical protein
MVGLGQYCTVTNTFVGDLRDVATVSQVTIQDIIAVAYDEQARRVGDDFRREARKHRPYTKGTTDTVLGLRRGERRAPRSQRLAACRG